MTLQVLAVARLVLPWAHLPATTALGSLDPQGRQQALRCGANVVMPNVTPAAFRERYRIYPNKICLREEPEHCRGCVEGWIKSLGREVADGMGHSPKPRFSEI
jgi:biotin synthase